MPKIPALKRIGPHNIDVISVIIGNMLRDGWGENRSNNTRFNIHMGSPNVEYLMWLHKFFYERGYCSSIKPKLKKNINKGNIIYFSYKFRTWTFSNLNCIYHTFYNSDKKKIIPFNIEELLTPLSLAIWIKGTHANIVRVGRVDGGVHPSGMILSTWRNTNPSGPCCEYNFNINEHVLLQTALKNKFNIKININFKKEGLILYITKNQLPQLSKLVKQYMIPNMYYKVNGY